MAYNIGDTISVKLYARFKEKFIVLLLNKGYDVLYSLAKKDTREIARIPNYNYTMSRVLLIEKRNFNSSPDISNKIDRIKQLHKVKQENIQKIDNLKQKIGNLKQTYIAKEIISQ